MERLHRAWTVETVAAEAQKYKTRTEFCLRADQAVRFAKRHGFYDEIVAHMDKKQIRWTPELIAEEARRHKSLSAFQANSRGAYNAAARLGIKSEVTAHMIRKGNRFKRCVYELRAGRRAYAGITYNFEKRVKEHRKAGTLGGKFIAVQLTDYIAATDAAAMERLLILFNVASSVIISTNKSNGGELGGSSPPL